MSVKENIHNLRKRLSELTDREITLVTVTKYAESVQVMEAYESGERDFGENYVNQLISRSEEFPSDIRWHMIGHIQTNKVKFLSKIPNLIKIHSIDSLRLVREIEKRFEKPVSGLIQINLSREQSKSGIDPSEVDVFFEELMKMNLEKLNITGLMTISPLDGDNEEKAVCFEKLKNIKEKINQKYSGCRLNLIELSMGMTDDFELALEKGSNILRIGSLIFN